MSSEHTVDLRCTEVTTECPAALNNRFTFHTATLVGHEVFVFGGYGIPDNRYLYVLNLQTKCWEDHLVPYDIAANRFGHSANLCDDVIHFVGGYNAARSRTEEVTLFDLVQREWVNPKTYGQPPPYLFTHISGLVLSCRTIVLLLKDSAPSRQACLYGLHVDTLTWSPLQAKGRGPSNRSGNACCSGKDKLYFYGGLDMHRNTRNDLFILSCVRENYCWTNPITSGTVPPGLTAASLTNVEGMLFLFGGQSSNEATSLLFIYNPGTGKWVDAQLTGDTPVPRSAHRCVRSPQGIIVLGGTNSMLSKYDQIEYTYDT